MNCDRAAELLVDYSEDALGARKKRALEEHLSGCEACRVELSQIESVKERVLSLDAPERDAEFWRRFGVTLSDRLAGEKHAVTDRRLLWRALAPAAGAACALVIALLILRGPDGRQSSAPEEARQTLAAPPAYEVSDFDYYEQSSSAIVSYFEDDTAEVVADMFLLIQEDLQAVSEEMVLYDIYEQTIYDYFEDLSADELDAMYASLALI